MADFLTPFDDANNPEAQGECERLAALLTAFFDGETAAEESRLARQHLIECARCALSLESWQRTRYLLQSNPVPPVPVGLLVRILLACRLSALPRRVKQTGLSVSTQPASFKAHDMEMLGAQRDEANFTFELAPSHGPASSATAPPSVDAPLHALIPTMPVPPHLKDEILKRTVGRVMEARPVISSQAPIATLPRPKLPRWDLGWASPRRASQFAAVAVPATLAWLLLVTPRMSGPELATSLPPLSPPAAVSHQARVSAPHRLAKLPTAPALVAAPASPSVAASAQPNPAPIAVAPVAPAVTAPGSGNNNVAPVEVARPDAHVSLASYEPPAKPVTPPVNHASAVANAAPVIKPVAARPQPQIAAPRLTLAAVPMKWSRSNEAVTDGSVGSGSRNLRAAVLDLDGQVRQPQNSDGDDNSDTADDISDISDHRPAEARQAIDSYRAALLSDAASDTSASDATDDSSANG